MRDHGRVIAQIPPTIIHCCCTSVPICSSCCINPAQQYGEERQQRAIPAQLLGLRQGRTEQRNQGRLPHLYLWRDRPTVPKWNGSPCTSRATALPPPYLLFINGICLLPSAALSQHEPIVPAERALQAKFKWPISVSMYFKAAFPACQGWVSNL